MKIRSTALAVVVCAAAACGGEAPSAQVETAVYPVVMSHEAAAHLAGSYDVKSGRLSLTEGTLEFVRSQALHMVIGDAASTPTIQVEMEIALTEGATIDLRDANDTSIATLVVEDASWIEGLDEAHGTTSFLPDPYDCLDPQ